MDRSSGISTGHSSETSPASGESAEGDAPEDETLQAKPKSGARSATENKRSEMTMSPHFSKRRSTAYLRNVTQCSYPLL